MKVLKSLLVLMIIVFLFNFSACDTSENIFEYRVNCTTGSIFITYVNSDGGTSQIYANSSWSYKWSKFYIFYSGQFLYISAQNQQDSGALIVQIFKNGELCKESQSSGAYVVAVASVLIN